jgi:hypothetical protein
MHDSRDQRAAAVNAFQGRCRGLLVTLRGCMCEAAAAQVQVCQCSSSECSGSECSGSECSSAVAAGRLEAFHRPCCVQSQQYGHRLEGGTVCSVHEDN